MGAIRGVQCHAQDKITDPSWYGFSETLSLRPLGKAKHLATAHWVLDEGMPLDYLFGLVLLPSLQTSRVGSFYDGYETLRLHDGWGRHAFARCSCVVNEKISQSPVAPENLAGFVGLF